MQLKGGDSLYLHIKAMKSGKDLSEGRVIGGDGVEYNGIPCYFYMTIGDEEESSYGNILKS